MSDLTGTKGGSGVWQRIISEMPEHDVYIEAFWGRGTIAKKKRPASVTIGIDQCDSAISSGSGSALMFRCDSLEWLRGYFFAQPSGRDAGSGDAGSVVVDRPSQNPATGDEAAYAATFGGFPWSRHLVYMDPPYLGCEHYYKYRVDHGELIDLFLSLPCPAMISGYWSEYYASRLGDSRSIQIDTVNRAGARCTEWVWMNFDAPIRYHDTRFVGSGRRERERIRRRVNNWASGLKKMSQAERQAILDAAKLSEHCPQ